jgi:phosphoglycolate phosphatase
MKTIVIFDMDGTLIDSGLDITLSINHVRERIYALEPLSVRSVVDAINAHQRNLAALFYGTEHYEERAKSLFETHYFDQCIQNIQPYEGIAPLLESLESRGALMGVATNAPGIFAKRMLSHLKLDRYFHLILGADDVEAPKPHPQMLHRHLDYHRYDAQRDHAWMIGDNSKDMEAAAGAGILGVFAGWGFSPQGEGDFFAASPASLAEILDTKFKG